MPESFEISTKEEDPGTKILEAIKSETDGFVQEKEACVPATAPVAPLIETEYIFDEVEIAPTTSPVPVVVPEMLVEVDKNGPAYAGMVNVYEPEVTVPTTAAEATENVWGDFINVNDASTDGPVMFATDTVFIFIIWPLEGGLETSVVSFVGNLNPTIFPRIAVSPMMFGFAIIFSFF